MYGILIRPSRSRPFGVKMAMLLTPIVVSGLILSLSCPAVAQKMPVPEAGEHVTLVVGDFRQSQGQPRLQLLERAIPELFHVALLPYDQIKIIQRGELWRQLARTSVPGSAPTPERIFQGDTLAAVGAKYILRGTFVEIEGRLLITCTLELSSGQTPVKIPPIRVDVDAIYNGVRQLAIDVVQRLAEAEDLPYKIRNIAVAHFQDSSSQPSVQTEWFAEDLGRTLTGAMSATRGTKVIAPFSKTGKISKEVFKQQVAPIWLAKADVVINGSVQIDNGAVLIEPEIYFVNEKLLLPLPKVRTELRDYPAAKRKLTSKIRRYLDSILPYNAKSRVADFSAKKNVAEMLKFAQQLADSNERSLAAVVLDQILIIEPDDPWAHYHLGLVCTEQRDFQDALQEFNKALKFKSDFAMAQKALGDTYVKMGAFPKAIEAYQETLKLDPSLEGVCTRMATAYHFLNDDEKAKHYLSQAIESDPRNPENYFQMGLVAGDEENAIDWNLKALQVDPQFEKARGFLADLFFRRAEKLKTEGKYSEAITNYDEVIRYAPTPLAHFRRAFCRTNVIYREQQRDFSPAINEFLTVLDLTSKEPERFRNYPYTLFNLIETYIFSQNYAKANTWAAESVKKTASWIYSNRSREEPAKLNLIDKLAAFYLVVTNILADQDYSDSLQNFRQLARPQIKLPGFFVEFDLLKNHVISDIQSSPEKQKLVLAIIEEMESCLKQ